MKRRSLFQRLLASFGLLSVPAATNSGEKQIEDWMEKRGANNPLFRGDVKLIAVVDAKTGLASLKSYVTENNRIRILS